MCIVLPIDTILLYKDKLIIVYYCYVMINIIERCYIIILTLILLCMSIIICMYGVVPT